MLYYTPYCTLNCPQYCTVLYPVLYSKLSSILYSTILCRRLSAVQTVTVAEDPQGCTVSRGDVSALCTRYTKLECFGSSIALHNALHCIAFHCIIWKTHYIILNNISLERGVYYTVNSLGSIQTYCQ